MEHASVVLDIAVALLLAAALGWAARRVGLPAVVGYLAAGLAISPFTPGYVADREQIQLLADIGVVLLLFEVGIEVDIARLHQEHRGLLWAAPLQMVVTATASTLVLLAIGSSPLGATLMGLAVALSSSVVIVNITRSRRRTTDRATEQALLGWSVLQDLAGVTATAIVLAAFGVGGRSPVVAIGALVAFALVAVAAGRVLPPLLVALRPTPDLFLIVSVAVGLLLAALGAVLFEVPMALAAFVAGLVLADTPETAEARRRLLPFRDLFAVLFFVAVGSLIDPARLPAALPAMALLIGLVVVAKVGVAFALARLARVGARPLQLAVGLGQLGEFGYVLAGIGVTAAALTEDQFTAILGAIVATIAGSAVAVRAAGRSPAASVEAEA
ncbi:MAG: cation:proton antiporter domain-containing protein [Candidatus Limnocylindrales bacterium]